MADACYAFCSPSHSQPSSPSGDKDANEDELEETELFNDTLVLNSPFTEPQVENLKLNTELVVEDSTLGEDMPSGPTFKYGDGVVLDSEDEEMDNCVTLTAVKGLLDDRTSPTVRIPSMRFQKRQLKPPYEQADSNATSFMKAAAGEIRVAVDPKSFNDKIHLYLPEGSNHIPSPEPGDPTQAALGFVDRYLSSDNVDLFQEIQYRKTTREKSPLVPSARGSLSLARKVEACTRNGEETFRFVDSDQNDIGIGIFCKEADTSSNFGSFRQTYMRTRQKEGGHLQNQGICSTGNRCDESLVQGPEMVTKNNSSFNELNGQSSVTRENVNAHSCLTHSEDMLDIGFDTQIAAEAMEALAFVPPTGCHFDDAHQPENELDGSLSILTENEAHLKNSLHGENSALHSMTTKSKKRNVLSCSFSKVTPSSSSKLTESPEPNPVSGKMQKMMKSKSTFEGQFGNNTTTPIFTEPVSLEEVCSTGEYMSFQTAAKETKNQNKSRWTRIRDQQSCHTKKDKNVKVEGTIRHKRMGGDLVADPLTLSTREKRLKRPTNSSGMAMKNKLNHQLQFSPQLSASNSLLRNDYWVYPKRARGKRKQANVQNNLDAPKEINVYPTKSLGGQDDEDKSCFPHTLPLCKASSDDSSRCLLMGMIPEAQPGSADYAMKFENQHDTHPLLLAHVGISSNKYAAQSSSEIPATISSTKGINFSNANHTYNEDHKKPCDKNMPKFSLLKELISLGVSKPTSNLIWKDLRQRRDMTVVRVLLSHHLDDTVIKKQKKILTRLNLSIASSSMEATHFIADKFTRTKNMLETMALGKLVVTHLWLEGCKQANCFIDEKSYILRDAKKEKEIGFCMPVSLARAKQNPLLKGKRVYITPHIKPDKKVIANLVTAVHGQVVDESQICADKDDKIVDDLLILSCEDDYAICDSFLKRGATVYDSELLLNGIVIQKLELEKHQLFKDQTTRNGPTTCKGKVYRRRSSPASAP